MKTNIPRNTRLTSAKVFFEDKVPYMELRYEYENDDGLHEVVFPAVDFPFSMFDIPNVNRREVANYFGNTNSGCLIRPLDVCRLNLKNIEVKTDESRHGNC